MLAIAHWMVTNGLRLEALCIVLLFESYLRASEAISLCSYQVIPPPVSGLHQMPYTSILAAAQESKVPTKTNEFDVTVLLDLPRQQALARVLVKLAASKHPRAPLWEFQYSQLRRAFGQALQALGLEPLGATLHGLRHGGASHDRLTHSRTLPEVQSRGNWRDPNTVRRYDKHARVGRQLQLLSPKCLALAERRAQELETNFELCFAPPSGEKGTCASSSSSSLVPVESRKLCAPKNVA